MKTIIAHIRLFRPLNLLTGAFAVYVSSAILRSLYQTSELTFAILTVVGYNAAANSLNDFIDLKIDQVNRFSKTEYGSYFFSPSFRWGKCYCIVSL